MKDAYVFGYGSLVNASTHDYPALHPAQLKGWRRIWRHVEGRTVAFLTVTRDLSSEISGVIAPVVETSWAALDARERSYLREPAADVRHGLDPTSDVRFYHAPEHLHRPHSGHHPVLLSYLDVVVQGYARLGGEDAVADFFDTTDGWDAPVLNDREAPRYARHQPLSGTERELVDSHIQRLGIKVTG